MRDFKFLVIDDAWREADLAPDEASLADAPVAKPRTWLLSVGWRKHGRLSITDRPASA